jgi:hypothetical protein
MSILRQYMAPHVLDDAYKITPNSARYFIPPDGENSAPGKEGLLLSWMIIGSAELTPHVSSFSTFAGYCLSQISSGPLSMVEQLTAACFWQSRDTSTFFLVDVPDHRPSPHCLPRCLIKMPDHRPSPRCLPRQCSFYITS